MRHFVIAKVYCNKSANTRPNDRIFDTTLNSGHIYSVTRHINKNPTKILWLSYDKNVRPTTLAEPERNFIMDFATNNPNSSSSEVLKDALYGGYTRFELELEVPFHIDFYPNRIYHCLLPIHLVCPIPCKPLLPEPSCLAEASTRPQLHCLPQISTILH